MKKKRGTPKKPVALRKLFRSVARRRKILIQPKNELETMLLNKELSKSRIR